MGPRTISSDLQRLPPALLECNETRPRNENSARETELREAEQEAENIKQALRHGKATTTLLEMVETTEARIQHLRAEPSAEPKEEEAIRALPQSVERYTKDLRSVLDLDTGRARSMLSRLLGDVVLRPDKEGLLAEVRSNLGVLLEDVPSNGAGSPAHIPASRFLLVA